MAGVYLTSKVNIRFSQTKHGISHTGNNAKQSCPTTNPTKPEIHHQSQRNANSESLCAPALLHAQQQFGKGLCRRFMLTDCSKHQQRKAVEIF